LDKFFSILIIVVLLSACSARIKLDDFPKPILSDKEYVIDTNVNLSLSVIETGYSITNEAFVFKGGRWFKKRKITHAAFLVQHPLGDFLFDTGLGSNVKDQVKAHFSFIQRTGSKHIMLKTATEILTENNYNKDSLNFILLSHLHWDHAGGVEDFDKPTVYVTKEEYSHAFKQQSEEAYFIKEQFDSSNIQWQFLNFDNVPYKVFLQSFDFFGDGTVVLVPMHGHTNGSIGMFVNLPSGKKYFFIGDAAWVKEAIDGPFEKHRIPRKQVDSNRGEVKNQLVLLHYLQKFQPDINIIPSHDYQVIKDLAHFPLVEK